MLGDVDAEVLARAAAAVTTPGILVVEAGLLAVEVGAIAAHDPTEGGIATGLEELAEASGLALEVDANSVAWFEPGQAVCAAVGADAWGALASGTLLVGFRPDAADRGVSAFEARGLVASAIAVAAEGKGVRFASGEPFPSFERDEVARVLSGHGA
jgi:hydrogenase maturation factor